MQLYEEIRIYIDMKNQYLLISLFFSLAFTKIQSQTPTEWQSDLQYLQQIIHSKYNNLFYNITSDDWDKNVIEFNTQIPNLEKDKILAGFIKLIAQFHIGHTQVNTSNFHAGSNNFQFTRLPYKLYWFSDGVYLIEADKAYEKIVGSKILKIGHQNIEDAIETLRPFVSYENEQGFRDNVMFFLASPYFLKAQGILKDINEISLTIRKNNIEEQVQIKANTNNNIFSPTGLSTPTNWVSTIQSNNTPLWIKEPIAFRYMEYIPDTKTLYVRHSVTLADGNKSIESFFTNMADFIDKNEVQKLVLDVRMNGGGNNTLNKPIITNIVKSRTINQKGKFFCIIGRRTFSAAQNLVNELEKYTEVTFVGEPTSENVNFYGDTRTETLPNSKLQINLSWLWWQNFAATDKRKATYPQLAVDMSFADYQNGIDPVMNVINTTAIQTNIETDLRNYVTQGKFEDAVSKAKEYLKDPLHRYFKEELEAKINAYGYLLINQNKSDVANKIFKMNIDLFPESANAWDSYAESFMVLGKKEDAIKYYEMAIAKDKDGATADNSKKQIEKIKSGN
ncbi:MAG: hypothetical protein ABI844_02730 [Saprospiraceae bacterium]